MGEGTLLNTQKGRWIERCALWISPLCLGRWKMGELGVRWTQYSLWFPDQHCLGSCNKSKFLGPTPDLLNQKLGVGEGAGRIYVYTPCGWFLLTAKFENHWCTMAQGNQDHLKWEEARTISSTQGAGQSMLEGGGDYSKVIKRRASGSIKIRTGGVTYKWLELLSMALNNRSEIYL
jgi:hypothetical protein